MSTNYEAIGRCQVLRKEIERLEKARNAAIMQLKEQLRATMGSARGTIYTFDPALAHAAMAEIEEHHRALVEAAEDFNEWAPAAGERPLTITEPRRR